MLVYMKLKNKTHKMKIQKGGQDITQSLPSIGSDSNNKELPVPIKRLPYDIKIFYVGQP